MNRKQRRAFVKKAKKQGVSKEAAEAYLAAMEMKIHDTSEQEFQEGEEVTIDVEGIQKSASYRAMSDKYKAFIEENKDKVFRIKYTKKKNLYALEGVDGWIFWRGDLKRAAKA